GRKVEHVEAHAGDVGQARLAVAEGAVSGARGRAREHLVPAAESRARRVGDQRSRGLEHGLAASIRIARDDLGEPRVERPYPAHERVAIAGELLRPGLERLAIGAPRAPGRLEYDFGARGERVRDVRGSGPALQVVAPGEIVVDPGGDGVFVGADSR